MRGKRYCHFIAPEKGGMWPARVICLGCSRLKTFDAGMLAVEKYTTEYWSGVLLNRSVGGYTIRSHTKNASVSDFWKRLAKACDGVREVWVISYRASDNWAMLGGWEQIEEGRFHADSLVIEDAPTIISFLVGGTRVMWIDTANYGASSPQDRSQGEGEANWVHSWFVWWESVCRQYNMGSLRPTVGSQAMHAFKATYYSGGIYNHVHAVAGGIESRGYYGGRCEVHHCGSCGVPLYHLDYRSLYPHCCSVGKQPARLRSVVQCPSVQTLRDASDRHGVIAEVSLATQEPAYPKRQPGRMFWPVGTFRTTLCGPELLDALERDRVKECHAATFYDMEPALKTYAEAIYDLRCTAEQCPVPGASTTAKLLCVALPGKFAQRSFRWKDVPKWHDFRYYGQWKEVDESGVTHRYRSIAGNVQRDVDMGLSPDANLAIAAYITSQGRMALLKAIRTAGWQHTFYCDTDSVMVDEVGYRALCAADMVADKEFGKLTLKEGPVQVELRGIKYYVQAGRTVCAGMPRVTTEGGGTAKQGRYRSSPSDSIRAGKRPEAFERIVSFERGNQSRHRIVHSDGSTEPIRLEE